MLGGGEGYLNDMNTETTNFDQTTLRSDEYFKNVTTLASVVMSCGTFLKVLGFLFFGSFLIIGYVGTRGEPQMPEAIKTSYLFAAGFLGARVWIIFHVLGVIATAQAKSLQAGLEERHLVSGTRDTRNRHGFGRERHGRKKTHRSALEMGGRLIG